MPGFESGGLAPASATFAVDDRLEQAEAIVRDFCRWHVAPSRAEHFAVTVHGRGHHVLVLPTRLLTDVQNVTVDGSPLDASHYEVDSIGMVRRTDCTRWRGQIELDMTHGYATSPPEIQGIIGDLAAMGSRSQVGLSGQVQMGPFGAGMSKLASEAGVAGLSDAQKAVLANYALEVSL